MVVGGDEDGADRSSVFPITRGSEQYWVKNIATKGTIMLHHFDKQQAVTSLHRQHSDTNGKDGIRVNMHA